MIHVPVQGFVLAEMPRHAGANTTGPIGAACIYIGAGIEVRIFKPGDSQDDRGANGEIKGVSSTFAGQRVRIEDQPTVF